MDTNQISITPTTSNDKANLKKIHKLSQDVISKISAGEVIQRPSNALKEMIENSLDAGSSIITITVKEGGMKLLQIQDNGSGIRLEDLDIVCERFTTSKLTKFEDLRKIQSFGFRGEALSSISHISHLKIQTKTPDSNCGYRACYVDGRLSPANPSDTSVQPKPCAGVNGTTITVEDLFFNIPSRKKIMKNTQEEHTRVVNLIKKYSINNSAASFILKKQGETTPEVHTPGSLTPRDVITLIYGADVGKELKEVVIKSDRFEIEMTGYFSSTNYNCKKTMFILFINNRLVESKSLKTGLEQIYSKYLPKGTHPFIFIRLLVHPRNIDVNIHPTKSEVKILHEDAIIELIQKKVEEELSVSLTSKTFTTQTIIPDFDDQTGIPLATQKKTTAKTTTTTTTTTNTSTNIASQNLYDKEKVRSDSKTQTLHAFINPNQDIVNNNKNSNNNDSIMDDIDVPKDIDIGDISPTKVSSTSTSLKRKQDFDQDNNTNNTNTNTNNNNNILSTLNQQTYTQRKPKKHKPSELTSIRSMVQELIDNCHSGLKEFFNDCIFVGCLDHAFCLAQFKTKLYLINLEVISKELIYQKVLKGFSDFDSIRFTTPLPIKELLEISLDSPISGWMPNDGPKDKIAEYLANLIITKKDILLEYYSIEIVDGMVVAIPQVLDNYVPCLDNFPIFLLRLATEVEWEFEKECLQGISREIAHFYKLEPSLLPTPPQQQQQNPPINLIQKNGKEWIVQHLLFPAFSGMLPPKSFSNDGTVIQITSLDNLYKVFERC